MDKKNTEEARSPASGAPSAGTATAEPVTAETPERSGPLRLKKGRRIQHGYRQGTVDYVRGGWSEPYDVRVRWDGEKYPQWIVFKTLELDYKQGKLTLLDGG